MGKAYEACDGKESVPAVTQALVMSVVYEWINVFV